MSIILAFVVRTWLSLSLKVKLYGAVVIVLVFAILKWKNAAVDNAVTDLINQSKDADNEKAQRIRNNLAARRLRDSSADSDGRGYRD